MHRPSKKSESTEGTPGSTIPAGSGKTTKVSTSLKNK